MLVNPSWLMMTYCTPGVASRSMRFCFVPVHTTNERCGRWCLSSRPHTTFTVDSGAMMSTLRAMPSSSKKSAAHSELIDLPVPGALRHRARLCMVKNAAVSFWCSIAAKRPGQL